MSGVRRPAIGAPAVWWMRGFVAEPYSYVVLPQKGINAEEPRAPRPDTLGWSAGTPT